MLLTTAWDEQMLDTAEIDAMQAEHKARRAQMRFFDPSRWKFWLLDRTFFKGVRNGKTVNDAREDAMFVFGVVCGVLGLLLLLPVLGVPLVAYVGFAVAGHWISLALNVGLCVLAFCFGFGLIGKWIRAGWRKVRHQDD